MSGSHRVSVEGSEALASKEAGAVVTAFLEDLGAQYIYGLLVAITLGAIGWLWRLGGRARVQQWWAERRFRQIAPYLLEQQGAYQTHLRDVMQTFWRAREDDPHQVRERIRREILEPIRGYIPTLPGEEIKVVWFRPTADRTALAMYEQVGHSPEGQAAMRLPIGAGLAGRAFSREELVESGDIESDDRFEPVEKGKARGSIMCAPIRRGNEVTGVLSVLSTCQDAFGLPDFLYLEALAAAIAALETMG